MSEKLKEEDAKKYKVVARILGVLTRIGSIFCWIGMGAVVLVTILMAVVAPNLKIDRSAKEIELFGNKGSYTIRDKEYSYSEDDVNFAIKDNTIKFNKGETAIAVKLSEEDIEKIEGFVENDAMKVIAALPFVLAMAAVAIAFASLALGHCASVLKNIATKETPFIEENVERSEKAAKYLLISFAITLVANLTMSLITNYSNSSFSFSSITTILGLYVLVYIFKSGIALGTKKAEK